jgi:4a-hydroxytetrahydrobiopterin dehydratase
MERKKLTGSELLQELSALPGWSLYEGKLHKLFTFPDFVKAFGFMCEVALVAQAMDHHPDWSNAYNRVTIDLVTHDLGGISTFDTELARRIENLLS